MILRTINNHDLQLKNTGHQIHYTLQIACAMCFIGHGCFGIITKEIWTNYFAVFGIGHQLSFTLMPYVGSMDILCGLLILFYPIRGVVIWLVAWGFITALLRPISGEPFPEFLERFGNFGAPLALLISYGNVGQHCKKFWMRLNKDLLIEKQTQASVILCLRFVVFFLLLGHGCLDLLEKKDLLDQYARLGFSDPSSIAELVGFFEVLAALVIIIKPFRYFVLAIFFWKVASEFFYPKYEIFEWIERGGGYGSVLALWFALKGWSGNYMDSSKNYFSLKIFLKQTTFSS